MKKIWLALLLLLLWVSPLSAQLTQTPNLGMYIIPFGYPQWNVPVNDNTTIIDAALPTLNLKCEDGQVPVWANGKFSVCGSSSINLAGNYAWTGTHTFTIGPTVGGQGVCLADGTNCPSAGAETDPAIKALIGVIVGTGTNAFGRTMTGGPGNITVTNPVTGNIVVDVGPNVALTTRSFAPTTGDFNFENASSLSVPGATGAAPTGSRLIAYDTTANRLKYGANGVTFTIANTSEVQFLNVNLSALAGLPGSNAKIPYFTGPGAMALTSGLETPCTDTGGQHLNISSVSPVLTFVCGTSSSGTLSGGTIDRILKYASATTATPSIMTESGGNINIAGGLVVGSGASLIVDTAAIATSDKIWTVINQSGTIRPSTGALVAGNMLTINANGQIIDGGAAGTGTWTDSSTNTGSNKTLVATGAGGTNTITTPIVASFEGGSITPDGSTCSDPTKTTINSGPTQYTFVCPTPNSAVFDAAIIGIRNAIGTIRVRLHANDTASATSFVGTFKAQCRASGTAPSSTWGTTQSVTVTLTTANNSYEGITAAITPNGTCSQWSDLYVRFNATGSSNSATARIVGLVIEQLS